MKKLLMMIAILVALTFAFTACGENEDEIDPNAVDFTSHTNHSVRVRNETSQRLVLFKSSLSMDTLIGGVPARANNHGLPANSKLFDKTEDFILVVLTEDQYNQAVKNNNLRSLENTPFTRIYAFFNRAGENMNVYSISDKLGGQFKLNIINTTTYSAELRLDSPQGDTLGFAPPQNLNTTLHVQPDDYNIFPVFKRYNQMRDTIQTLVPTGTSGFPWFQMMTFEDEAGSREHTFNVSQAVANLQTSTSGVAWLVVDNQTTGGIRVVEGNTVIRTPTGTSGINSGRSRTFQVDMNLVSGGSQEVFSTSRTLATWSAGPTGFEKQIVDLTNNSNLSLKSDFIYTVVVTGSHNNESLVVKVNLSEENDAVDNSITYPRAQAFQW
jgi:hypothetical protein